MRPVRLRTGCLGGFAIVFMLVLSATTVYCDDMEDEKGETEATVETVNDDKEIVYTSPKPSKPVYFAESFDDYDAAKAKWIKSKAQKKDNENVFKYEGEWDFKIPQKVIFPADRGLVLQSKAKHGAIAAKLNKPFVFKDKPMFVQYEVTFQNGMDCGGAYIKLLSAGKDLDLFNFHDKTPYSIMFGPDKCGNDIKHHFIFRHKNPINGTYEEKHAKRPSNRADENFSDKLPHFYRLNLYPENTFEIIIDGKLINSGSLLKDVDPPVNPPVEIDDPDDSKPIDWDDREKVPDLTARKPEDWDEDAPQRIPDPNAVKPDDWLDDEPQTIPVPDSVKPNDWDKEVDGEWEPAMMTNPKCAEVSGCGPWEPGLIENPQFKGKWRPPMIENPDYKGTWKPRKIPNPAFFEDKEPFKMTPVSAVGLEIWSMTDNVLFDNFIITDDEDILEDWTKQTFDLKQQALNKDSEGVVKRLINYSNAHPWLWAVYIVVVGLPIVLIFTFCCGSKSDKASMHPKKTDAVTPDDDLQDGGVDSQTESTDYPKDDEQEEEAEDAEEAEETEEVEEEEEEDESSEQNEETVLEATNAASNSANTDAESNEGGESRRRRPRKE